MFSKAFKFQKKDNQEAKQAKNASKEKDKKGKDKKGKEQKVKVMLFYPPKNPLSHSFG